MTVHLRVLGVGLVVAIAGLVAFAAIQPEEETQLPTRGEVVDAPHGSAPLKAIPELIASSALIVRARVERVDEPRWNSRDGRSWMAEWQENPSAFRTAPMQATRVTATILAIAHAGPGVSASVGDVLPFEVVGRDPSLTRTETRNGASPGFPREGTYVDPGIERIFFLYQSPFPYPDYDEAPDVWTVQPSGGVWAVLSDIAIPADSGHQQELSNGAQEFEVVEARPGVRGIRWRELRRMAA